MYKSTFILSLHLLYFNQVADMFFINRSTFHFSLEEVDTNGELNSLELKHLVKTCPNLYKLRFKYHRNSSSEDEDHLAKLCVLDHLTQLSISCANFFEHHLFQLLEVRGDQILHLELVDVDEINLNGILMLGANCTNLKKLCLHGCHFQMQPEDIGTVDALCQSKFSQDSGKFHRNY